MFVDDLCLRLAETDEVDHVGKNLDEALVRGLVQVLEGKVVDAALQTISKICMIWSQHLTSRSSFRRMTKKAIRSRVSLVKMRSASAPQLSSAAARMAGATTSRVVFMSSSASHSNTF